MRQRAHPRSRGENLNQSITEPTADGSSPLTRGKHPAGFPSGQTTRLIPAHAGKTREGCGSGSTWEAHPRSRGENQVGETFVQIGTGSSPLTRGKPPRGRRGRCRHGLIPAHAGKTHLGFPGGGHCRAHPRSRGENDGVVMMWAISGGSSPLTRGKPPGVSGYDLWSRLIPAHAGKTCTAAVNRVATWAHPRSRGENLDAPDRAISTNGSSPLTRGKQEAFTAVGGDCGLIPAHAGKTVAVLDEATNGTAHPRSRGENASMLIGAAAVVGSSPLTRGKPWSGPT